MKTGNDKKGKVKVDTSLNKHVGKNASKKKTESFMENREQIEAAIEKYSKPVTY